MLLAIDIGNTNIVLGVFHNDKLKEKWRISTEEKKTVDEYSAIIKSFLQNNTVAHGIISNVVPNLNTTFKNLFQKYFNIKPITVSYKSTLNINLKYPNPAEIGADRIVNAAAATALYKPPLIIVDFGTATTIGYVDKENNYHGGLILPGIPLMLKALHIGTAKLPEVEIAKPMHLIGENTVENIQSGVYYQTIGSLNYIIDLLKKKYSKNSNVILTGGLAELFQEDIKPETVIDRDLTLKGLNIIYKLNNKNTDKGTVS